MFVQLSGHSKDPVPVKTPRAKVACSRCRRLKTKCRNKDDGTPCETCESKKQVCEYTQVAPANTTAPPRSPTSTDSVMTDSSVMTRHSSDPSGVVQQGITDPKCLCNIPGEHVCRIPQIPVGQLSDAMRELRIENAQRYPQMRNLDDLNR